MRSRATLLVAVLALALAAAPSHASATRLLDLCDVSGVRPNQLVGYGLVVGLNQTGDTGRARFTVQSTAAMLRRLGATVDPEMIQTRNAAAVMVTATLPADARAGMRIDVTVSSLGNARSLQGGTLLQTPLYAADRRVYAVAQGAVLLGGFGASSGASGSSASFNHLTAGRVPFGAIVEREAPREPTAAGHRVILTLREPSFVTARRTVEAIDASLGAGVARAVDSATIEVMPPEGYAGDRVQLLAELQLLEVQPETRARVVIDERTGTVVVGAAVRLREAAIAQGGLTVEISETALVSQPPAFSGDGAATVVVPQTDLDVHADGGSLRMVPAAASLSDVVTALNALGAQPRDLVAILQALHRAGALDAEIEVQ